MDLMFVFVSVILVLISLYYYLTWHYNFWQKQGIPCANGRIPGLGNMAPVIFLRKGFVKLCEDFYKENENHSMFGFYHLLTPSLLIRDPELVKSVLLSNFSNFHQNLSTISCPKEDVLLSINPFFSKTIDEWKENRAPLTNAFSSKKLKLMVPLIQDATSKMENYLKKKICQQNGILEIELKKFFNLYTGQISSTGIGIQGHNFEENEKSTIKELTHKKIIESMFKGPAFSDGVTQPLIRHCSWLARLLNLYMTPKEMDLFFRHTVKNLLDYRISKNIIGNDYFQMVIDYLKANGSKADEETTLASFMLSFSIEIYETSALTLSFLGFQLACHPEIQNKVREEIKSVYEKCNGKLNYEVLKEMKYLDQVLNESMRLNHISGTMTKVCTQETQLVGSDGLSCKIKPGHLVAISTFGLQMDPKYWPDPEKFDPDRFSETQKASRHKFTFIPFGEGPRICPGIRMAVIMIKMAIATILHNYSLEVSPKSPLPLKKNPTNALTMIEGGLWVFLKPLKLS